MQERASNSNEAKATSDILLNSTPRQPQLDRFLSGLLVANPPSPEAAIVSSRRSTPLVLSRTPSRPVAVAPSASSPVLFSLYSRRAASQNDADAEALPTTSSSHSILVLRSPVFGVRGTESKDSIQNSDTGSDKVICHALPPANTNEEDGASSCRSLSYKHSPSLPADGLWRHSSLHVDSDAMLRQVQVRRRVTATAQVEIVNYWENPRFPLFLHLRHSFPTVRGNGSSAWIHEETEKEALDSMSTTTSTSTVSQAQTSSGVPSTLALVSSSTVFDPPEQELTEYILQPMPSLVWDYVHPDNTVTPEHPFPRRAHGRPPALAAVLAYINTPPPADPDPDSPQSSQIGRRHGFTRPLTANSTPAQRQRGFMARLRSELFYNVLNPFPYPHDLDLDEDDDDDHDLATDASEDEFGNDILDDGGEADGEENSSSGGSEAGSSSSDPTPVSSQSSISTGSSETLEILGDGDADSDISGASSRTSLPSDTNVPEQLDAGWILPSTTAIGGGKYDFFRETQRPRPFTGHKYVVSMFGAEARQNENRPAWIPTYADRLQCILNQYLESQDRLSQLPTTQMEAATNDGNGNVGRRTSVPNSILSVTGVDAEERPLKMSQEQIEPVNKVVSWSVDITQRPDSDEDSANANFPMSLQGDFGKVVPSQSINDLKDK